MSQPVTSLKRCQIKFKWRLADTSHSSLFMKTGACRLQFAFLDIWKRFVSHPVFSNFSSLPPPNPFNNASWTPFPGQWINSPDSPPHKRWLFSMGTRIYFISFFLPSGFVSACATPPSSPAVNSSVHVSSQRCSDSCWGQRIIAGQSIPHETESRWHSCWRCVERPVCWPLRWGWHCQLPWKPLTVALTLCEMECPGLALPHYHHHYCFI